MTKHFEVIPVIDVRDGVVVHAVAGDRSLYKPLETPLAKSSNPADVARGFMNLHPFRTVYLADLNGIEGRGPTPGLLEGLADVIEAPELWVDDGTGDATGARPVLQATDAHLVIGTETLKDPHTLEEIIGLDPERIILSLDFRGQEFIGPGTLLAEPDFWPDRVIVMALERVGTGEGPALNRLAEIVDIAGGRRVYAAGGVRNAKDLQLLSEIGVAGVLVSSALHAGTITAGDLQKIAGR